MRVIVNALSANHPSARHVLYGHLNQIANWTATEHEFLIVAPAQQNNLDDAWVPSGIVGLPNVDVVEAPAQTRKTIPRRFWEHNKLPRLINEWKGAIYFTPTGTVLRKCSVPQISLAQNPWCMIDTVTKNGAEKLRACVQRRAYGQAQQSADLMAYNSKFMRSLYRQNRDVAPRKSVVAYQGIQDRTHDEAERIVQRGVERAPRTIVAVSVMAAWKGADTLVKCLIELQSRHIPAKLRLVGPWPDQGYETQVRELVRNAGLDSSVTITGRVSQDQLHREMWSAQVFALPSRCESFGIPAVEAQAFGTPVVGSDTTAMKEIGGKGGHFCHPNDIAALSDGLERLITDESHWNQISRAARENARRFRWENCSRPLMQMFALDSNKEWNH